MFLYRDILKKSFTISLRHKYLWFFGLFAALLGTSNNLKVIFSRATKDWGQIYLIISENFKSSFASDPSLATSYLIFLLIFIVVVLFVFWLAVVSQAGLINNLAEIIKSNGKKKELTLKDGLNIGIKNFWQVFFLNMVASGIILLLLLLIKIPLLFITAGSGSLVNIIYLLFFIIFIPLALIVSFLLKYAICFVVINKEKAINAIEKAWKLFIANWLISLEISLILFFMDILFILANAFILFIISLFFLFIAVGLALVVSANIFPIILEFGVILAVLFIIFTGAVFTTFKLTVWTDLFIHLAGKGGLAKLIRLTSRKK